MVIQEIIEGDAEAVKRRQIFTNEISILSITNKVKDLANKLMKVLALPQRAEPDALHLAFAMQYDMDFLLTWNCTHLANGLIISKLKEFEIKTSQNIPVIVTPEELIPGGEDDAMD